MERMASRTKKARVTTVLGTPLMIRPPTSFWRSLPMPRRTTTTERARRETRIETLRLRNRTYQRKRLAEGC
jgi:hypothetical protein